MAKENSITIKVCDWIVKYCIYAVIFFVPILFLPWTSDALDFNKTALLVLLSFVALFAWMLKVLVSGKIKVNTSKINFVIGGLFLVYFFATVFSVNKYGSFWGWPQPNAESLVALIGLAIMYFLISNTFLQENVVTGIKIISVSALIAEILGALHLFGLFIFPFSFAKSISFNTVGAPGALGFFAAILLPITIISLIISGKWWRALLSVQLVLITLILFLVNYPIIWWSVLLGSVVVVIFGVFKRNLFDGRWMALPMFFLAVSLFFILLHPPIQVTSEKPNEILLSQKSGLEISLKVLKERPIFGSGLGTFSYDFLKFKDPSFSQGPIWTGPFSQASSKVLNVLSTAGILGFLVLFVFMVLPIFYAVKFLILEKDDSRNRIMTLGVLSVLIMQVLIYFLYNSNLTLEFLSFFMIASLVVLTSVEKKEYQLRSSSLFTLIITFSFTLFFIFGFGLIILDGQRYVAEIRYSKALSFLQAGDKNLGTKNMESAVYLNSSSDLYLEQLSQAYLINLQDEIKNVTSTPTDQEKSKVQVLITNSVNAAKMATDLNPNSSDAWSNRGYVYQSLNGLISDSTTWAIKSYDQALSLNPNDPYIFYQEGIVYYVAKQNQNAKEKLEKAVALTPDYSNALYFLGLSYDALGDKVKALEQFNKIQQLNPEDKIIQNIINNLNAGLSALQQPAEIPVTPPTTEAVTPVIK